MDKAVASKKAVSSFEDWAGQTIPYRLRETNADEERSPQERVTCEIDPHGDCWHVMGRGMTEQQAVSNAIKAWNEYDQA